MSPTDGGEGTGHGTSTPVVAPPGSDLTGPSSAPPDQAGHRPHWLVLSVLVLGWCGFGFQGVLVAPVLSLFASKFDQTTGMTSYVLTSALLVAAIATPLLTRAGDRYGTKLMMSVATGMLAVGALIAAVADNFAVLLIGRGLQGASAAMLPLGLSMIRQVFAGHHVHRSSSILGAAIGVPSGIGLVLSGLFIRYGSLSTVLWFSAAYGLVAFAATVVVLPNPRANHAGGLDLGGIALLSAGLVCLLLPLSQGATWGWGSSSTLGLLLAAAVLFALWVGVERRATDPVVDLRGFIRPAMLSTSVATFVFGFASLVSFVALITMVQADRGALGYGFTATVLQAGLYVLPSSLVQFAMAFVAGRLGRAFSNRILIAVGTLIGAAGLALFALAHSASWHIYLFSIIYSAGFGLSFACVPPRLVDTVAPEEMASASSTNAILFNVSQALGGAVLAGTLAAATAAGDLNPGDNGYRAAGLIGAVVAAVGAVAFLHQSTVARTRS